MRLSKNVCVSICKVYSRDDTTKVTTFGTIQPMAKRTQQTKAPHIEKKSTIGVHFLVAAVLLCRCCDGRNRFLPLADHHAR